MARITCKVELTPEEIMRAIEGEHLTVLPAVPGYSWQPLGPAGNFAFLLTAAEEIPQTEARPIAWMTEESMRRLRRGGNGSRETVPVHANRSKVATIPVYIDGA